MSAASSNKQVVPRARVSVLPCGCAGGGRGVGRRAQGFGLGFIVWGLAHALAASPHDSSLASGWSPRAAALAPDTSTSAAAPSLMLLLLPAASAGADEMRSPDSGTMASRTQSGRACPLQLYPAAGADHSLAHSPKPHSLAHSPEPHSPGPRNLARSPGPHSTGPHSQAHSPEPHSLASRAFPLSCSGCVGLGADRRLPQLSQRRPGTRAWRIAFDRRGGLRRSKKGGAQSPPETEDRRPQIPRAHLPGWRGKPVRPWERLKPVDRLRV